jgi:hypothetical protein
MIIQCDIKGIEPHPVLLKFFDRVLREAAGRVSLDLATIDRVVIVSSDRFGAAVDSIKSGATHTNTATAIAVGKTISRRDGSRVVCDIVLHSSLFEVLVKVLGSGPASNLWGLDEERAIYVICHEFGHAIDHNRRNDASEFPDPRARPFSIQETADYYGRIVETEYAACRNSASVMTEPLFSNEMQEAANRMTECCRQVKQCLENSTTLTPPALAHSVCQGAWLYMVELTKLYGHANGVAGREAGVRTIETELLEGTPLGDFLDSIGATYPHWDTQSQIGELTVIWQKYAKLSGVQFVAHDSGPDEMACLAM